MSIRTGKLKPIAVWSDEEASNSGLTRTRSNSVASAAVSEISTKTGKAGLGFFKSEHKYPSLSNQWKATKKHMQRTFDGTVSQINELSKDIKFKWNTSTPYFYFLAAQERASTGAKHIKFKWNTSTPYFYFLAAQERASTGAKAVGAIPGQISSFSSKAGSSVSETVNWALNEKAVGGINGLNNGICFIARELRSPWDTWNLRSMDHKKLTEKERDILVRDAAAMEKVALARNSYEESVKQFQDTKSAFEKALEESGSLSPSEATLLKEIKPILDRVTGEFSEKNQTGSTTPLYWTPVNSFRKGKSPQGQVAEAKEKLENSTKIEGTCLGRAWDLLVEQEKLNNAAKNLLDAQKEAVKAEAATVALGGTLKVLAAAKHLVSEDKTGPYGIPVAFNDYQKGVLKNLDKGARTYTHIYETGHYHYSIGLSEKKLRTLEIRGHKIRICTCPLPEIQKDFYSGLKYDTAAHIPENEKRTEEKANKQASVSGSSSRQPEEEDVDFDLFD